MFEKLEKYIGLHQQVEIYYVVDGYEAVYLVIDGAKQSASAKGKTIEEALLNLEKELE